MMYMCFFYDALIELYVNLSSKGSIAPLLSYLLVFQLHLMA